MSAKDWYARRLNATNPTAPVNEPAPVFTPVVVAGRQFNPVAPAVTPADRQAQEDVAEMTKSATHLRRGTEACPECGGTNYFGPNNTRPRCWDCGYPVLQSGSGAGSSSPSGSPGTKALQVDTQGTWGGGDFSSGEGIIAHIT